MLKLCSLERIYGDQILFEKLSLNISPGQWTTILGPSGVGKSSLLRIIARLDKPDYGTIVYPLHSKVSYLTQQPPLLPWLSVVDNILLSKKLNGGITKDDILKANTLLKDMSLISDARKRPFQLSGGMQQLVAIARIIFEDNPIILMDEPFNGLDTSIKNDIQDLALRSFKDKYVIFVTHDPVDALKLGDRICVLAGGDDPIKEFSVDGATPRSITSESVKDYYDLLVRELDKARGGV